MGRNESTKVEYSVAPSCGEHGHLVGLSRTTPRQESSHRARRHARIPPHHAHEMGMTAEPQIVRDRRQVASRRRIFQLLESKAESQLRTMLMYCPPRTRDEHSAEVIRRRS